MSKTDRKRKPENVLPPVTVMEGEAKRLNALAGTAITRLGTSGTWCWCIHTKRT